MDIALIPRILPTAMLTFYVYMLRCSDGSLYVGHTDNLERRLSEHRLRLYCGYTAKRLPVKLIYHDTFNSRDEAFQAERRIKGWSRAKKLALAEGDWQMVQRLALRRTPQSESYRRSCAPGSRTSP